MGLVVSSLVLLAALAVAAPGSELGRDDTDELLERVTRLRDRAEPEDIDRIAGLGTSRAAEALIEAYDGMATVHARRAVVRALGLFDGAEDVAGARALAFDQLVLVATTSGEPTLREEAVEALGGANHGRSWLVRIVESPAEDEVRIHAMQRHVEVADASDPEVGDWYRVLLDGAPDKKEKKDKKKRRKGDDAEEPELEVHTLPELRALALEGLAPGMKEKDLVEASEDSAYQVRRVGLLALEERDPKAAARRAGDMFERIDERPDNRVLAARILAEAKGERVASDFIDVGCKLATPEELRAALADLLAGFANGGVDSKIAKLLGKSKAKAHERVFALRAARQSNAPKLISKIAKELEFDDLDVRLAAVDALARRADPEVAAILERTLAEAQDTELVVAVLDALTGLRGDEPEWQDQLEAFARSDEDAVRNAAFGLLARDVRHFDLFVAALEHPQWATRFQALQALATIGTKEVVPILIERLEVEEGRLQRDIADVLFRLTGQPYRTAAPNWKAWWESARTTFEVLTPAELERARAREEERAQRETTRARFFGIRIESRRIVFVIDVSGSMAEPLRARFVGDTTLETRLQAAVRELGEAIDALDPRTQFNIIAFESGVTPWLERGLDGGAGASGTSAREEAKTWLARLGPLGGTNLYDAARHAFSDEEVDTIFLLSDGEPSDGEETDPFVIREHVRRWNEHRGVVIHAVAIGSSLDVLEWLAADAGGTYRQLR